MALHQQTFENSENSTWGILKFNRQCLLNPSIQKKIIVLPDKQAFIELLNQGDTGVQG